MARTTHRLSVKVVLTVPLDVTQEEADQHVLDSARSMGGCLHPDDWRFTLPVELARSPKPRTKRYGS